MRFSAEPGSETFVDLIAPSVTEVVLNGRSLDLRFRLPNGWDSLEPAWRDLAGKALKRDVEMRLCGNYTSVAGNASTAAPEPVISIMVSAVASRMSSTIWKTIPKLLPYSVRASISGRSCPVAIPPMRAAVP